MFRLLKSNDNNKVFVECVLNNRIDPYHKVTWQQIRTKCKKFHNSLPNKNMSISNILIINNIKKN